MGSPYQTLARLKNADYLMPAPATGSAIVVDRQDAAVPLDFAGTYTGTLANPVKVGQRVLIYARTATSGSFAITFASAVNQRSDTVATFAAAGDFMEITSIHTSAGLRWRVTAIEGVSGISATQAQNVQLVDQGGFTDTSNLETAIAELYQHLFSGHGGNVLMPLTAFREVSAGGDPGDASANGGVLASDTTPILLADAAEALNIRWAASNSDPIAIGIALPSDYDDTANMAVDIQVLSAGVTNTPTFTVETSWDGGAKVSDTATGTAVATLQTATATIAAADIPAGAVSLTLGITPGAHTTDIWDVYAVRLKYKRKLLLA